MARLGFRNTIGDVQLHFYLDKDRNLVCNEQDTEPFEYVTTGDCSVVDMINNGSIYKSGGEIIFNVPLRWIDEKYIIKHYDEYVSMAKASKLAEAEQPMTEELRDAKAQISLDDLGIVLENVEVVCTDSIKIIARKSKSIMGANVDIVL